METPIKMDDLGVFPYFWKHPYLGLGNPNRSTFIFQLASWEGVSKNPRNGGFDTDLPIPHVLYLQLGVQLLEILATANV